MGHDHSHAEVAIPAKRAIWGYGIAGVLAVVTFILEVWGQHAAHSTGLLADAFHVASDGWFYIAAFYAALKSTSTMTQTRIARIGLMLAGFITIVFATTRLTEPRIVAPTMFVVAFIGLLLNIVMVVVLTKAGGSHGHSHSHRAAVLHTMADLASSAVVCIVALIAYSLPNVFWPQYLDPICAIGIGAMLIWQGHTMHKHA